MQLLSQKPESEEKLQERCCLPWPVQLPVESTLLARSIGVTVRTLEVEPPSTVRDRLMDRPSRGSNHEWLIPDHPGVHDGSRARVSRQYSPDGDATSVSLVRRDESLGQSSQSEAPPHTFKILPLSGARAATVTVSRATSYKLGPRDGVTGHDRQHTRA
jgi:hypothetical protein